jgi:MoxR-like ATPase
VPYTPWFDPAQSHSAVESRGPERGDRSESIQYFYTDPIAMAVNVALATERPLLVSGPSGCGKTTLAADIARVLGWGFEKEVITSRTQATDLQYKVDHMRRLQDATDPSRELRPIEEYISAGVLWRAFDPDGARERRASKRGGIVRGRVEPPGPGRGVVVLLDEIDKADPDVPNNLLEPLGAYRFAVPELDNAVVEALRTPLLVITTNNERRLPDAFIRRCVEVAVPYRSLGDLKEIARRHFPALAEYVAVHPGFDVLNEVYNIIGSKEVSTAEYLDTVGAVLHLDIAPHDPAWKELPTFTVRKPAKALGAA